MPGRKTAPKPRGRKPKKIKDEEEMVEENDREEVSTEEHEDAGEQVDEENKAEDEEEDKPKVDESEEEKPVKKTEKSGKVVEKNDDKKEEKKEMTDEEIKKKLTVDMAKMGKKKLSETGLLELLQYAYTKAETDMNSIIARGIEELYKGHMTGRYIHVNRPRGEYLNNKRFSDRRPPRRPFYSREGQFDAPRLQPPPKFSQNIVQRLSRQPYNEEHDEEHKKEKKREEVPEEDEEVNMSAKTKKVKKEKNDKEDED